MKLLLVSLAWGSSQHVSMSILLFKLAPRLNQAGKWFVQCGDNESKQAKQSEAPDWPILGTGTMTGHFYTGPPAAFYWEDNHNDRTIIELH